MFPLVTGRAPNTKRLNLDTVGVELDSKTGAIKVSCYPLNICKPPHVSSFLERFSDLQRERWRVVSGVNMVNVEVGKPFQAYAN